MRQCEFKKRYDPILDQKVGTHIYGEGITDIFKTTMKSVGKKLFNKAAKSTMKAAAKKTGEVASKKAGDKIVELLTTKNNGKEEQNMTEPIPSIVSKQEKQEKEKIPSIVSQMAVNERINQMLSGGKLRRRNFI